MQATTSGGSRFDLDVRMGGSYASEKKIVGRIQKDPVGNLKEFVALGDGMGTYGRVTLAAKGADLDIGPDGFTIHDAALVPKVGSVTHQPRRG